MSVVTLIGAGQMASALTFPLFENGHEVRLVGSPLDDAVIDRLREDNYHVNLRRTLHDGINYIKCADVKEAIKGADLIVCGISSFGVEWFADEILPILDESIPLISVTKGMLDYEDGTMQTYPEYWQEKLPEGSKLRLYAIGGPCTARDYWRENNHEKTDCHGDGCRQCAPRPGDHLRPCRGQPRQHGAVPAPRSAQLFGKPPEPAQGKTGSAGHRCPPGCRGKRLKMLYKT